MKKLYSIRLVMPFLLAFGFSSCVVYSPHNADIPLLYERGQLQIDASASLSAPLLAVPAVNASVAYSPFNHVAVQGAASLSALNSIYAQGAVGTYFPFGNLVLECYAGYGYGYTNIDSIASTTASSGYRINGNYNLYYGQLNLGWAQLLDGYLDLGFGVKGGLLAPFFIALTTVLVSFSCTGPILGAALVSLSTSTTDRWVSLITMLGFGIGFAAPFTLLAMFPSVLKNMKSGGWLNTVKVVFAFLELAFGLKFLSMADLYCHWHLLDRETYLALWIVIFGLMGFYLLGKLKFKGDEDLPHIGVVRLFLAIVDLAFVVYMIPGLWGAPLKAISGFLPPMTTQDFNIERTVEENAGTVVYDGSANGAEPLPADRKYADRLQSPAGYHGFFDLDEAKAYARKVGKPIFIDFTGHTCNNCREMEHLVWSDKEVKEIINQKFVLCELYVDEQQIQLPESEWITDDKGHVLKTLGRRNLYYEKSMFNMNAQPYYVIINADGQVLTKENYKYDRDVQKFIAFLNEGLSNMK